MRHIVFARHLLSPKWQNILMAHRQYFVRTQGKVLGPVHAPFGRQPEQPVLPRHSLKKCISIIPTLVSTMSMAGWDIIIQPKLRWRRLGEFGQQPNISVSLVS